MRTLTLIYYVDGLARIRCGHPDPFFSLQLQTCKFPNIFVFFNFSVIPQTENIEQQNSANGQVKFAKPLCDSTL